MMKNKNAEHFDEIIVRNLCELTSMIIQQVTIEGKMKGKNSYNTLGGRKHAERALQHITMYLAGDRSEPHLAHALWRIAVALEKESANGVGYDYNVTCPYCQLPMVSLGMMAGNDGNEQVFFCSDCVIKICKA